MKLTIFLFVFCIVQTFAGSVYSQTSHLTLDVSNSTIENVLLQIEQQSNFVFLYNRDIVDVNRLTDIQVKKASIEDVLNKLFAETNISYRVIDRQIVLSPEFTEQPRTITGQVTDSSGAPLPGVTVVVRGTTQGTVANGDGNYTLSNVPGDATLVFSFVGMKTQEIAVAGNTNINVVMVEGAIGIEEVVAIGYGTVKKSDLTASISSIDVEDLQKFPVSSTENALQGMAPGVETIRVSGAPGSSSRIRIRGIGSINNTSEPIIIIDGVIGNINTVNPSDIQSIEVLKDAAYAAVYGARAANGVILVTTKGGERGKTKVSVNAYAGVQDAWKVPEPLGRDNYAMIIKEMYENAGAGEDLPGIFRDIIDNPSNYPDENIMDNVFQTGYIQKYEVSVAGGGENSTFYLSGGYFDEKGTIIETDHKRYNLRLNSSFDVGKLTIGENVGLVYRNTNGFTPQRPKNNMILRESVWWAPFVPAYDESTSHGYGEIPGKTGNNSYNYVAVMELSDYLKRDINITGNVFGEYEFIDGLKYRLNVGIDYDNPYDLYHMKPYPLAGVWKDDNNYIDNETRRNIRVIVENIATYSKEFGDHDLNLMAGYTQERFNMEGFSANGQGAFASNDISSLNQLLGDNFGIGGTLTEWNLASYLGRVSYGFKGRYLLTGLIRRDGSSKFGPERKWGIFPSVSAAWRISEEPFFNLPWMSNAKLRVSRGTLGRLPNANFAWVATLGTRSKIGFGDEVAVGAAEKSSFADAGLKWETETQTNVGLDIGLLQGQFTFTADYYDRVTDDMLLERPLPLSSGYSNADVNIGSIRNSGFESSLAYRNSIGEFKYDISGNISMYYNEVLDIGGEDKFISSGEPKQHQGVGYTTRTVEGEPVGSFYGLRAIGIYQNESEIDETFAPNAVPGDVIFADLDNDGKLTDKDKTFIGNPFPDMTYGFNLNFEYKGFDLSARFYGVQGIDVFNANLFVWRAGYSSFNQTTDVLTRWTPKNGGNKWPRVVFRNSELNNNWQASDLYIEDGSYLRCRLATLGYTLPSSLTKSFGLNRVRVYIQSQNLFTFTDYSGIDPEVAGDEAVLGRGVDEGDNYPSPRGFSGGIQFDF